MTEIKSEEIIRNLMKNKRRNSSTSSVGIKNIKDLPEGIELDAIIASLILSQPPNFSYDTTTTSISNPDNNLTDALNSAVAAAAAAGEGSGSSSSGVTDDNLTNSNISHYPVGFTPAYGTRTRTSSVEIINTSSSSSQQQHNQDRKNILINLLSSDEGRIALKLNYFFEFLQFFTETHEGKMKAKDIEYCFLSPPLLPLFLRDSNGLLVLCNEQEKEIIKISNKKKEKIIEENELIDNDNNNNDNNNNNNILDKQQRDNKKKLLLKMNDNYESFQLFDFFLSFLKLISLSSDEFLELALNNKDKTLTSNFLEYITYNDFENVINNILKKLLDDYKEEQEQDNQQQQQQEDIDIDNTISYSIPYKNLLLTDTAKFNFYYNLLSNKLNLNKIFHYIATFLYEDIDGILKINTFKFNLMLQIHYLTNKTKKKLNKISNLIKIYGIYFYNKKIKVSNLCEKYNTIKIIRIEKLEEFLEKSLLSYEESIKTLEFNPIEYEPYLNQWVLPKTTTNFTSSLNSNKIRSRTASINLNINTNGTDSNDINGSNLFNNSPGNSVGNSNNLPVPFDFTQYNDSPKSTKEDAGEQKDVRKKSLISSTIDNLSKLASNLLAGRSFLFSDGQSSARPSRKNSLNGLDDYIVKKERRKSGTTRGSLNGTATVHPDTISVATAAALAVSVSGSPSGSITTTGAGTLGLQIDCLTNISTDFYEPLIQSKDQYYSPNQSVKKHYAISTIKEVTTPMASDTATTTFSYNTIINDNDGVKNLN